MGSQSWTDERLQRIPAGHWLGAYRAEVFRNVFYPEDVNFAYDMVFLTRAYLAARQVAIIRMWFTSTTTNPNSVMNSPVSWKKIYGDVIWRIKGFELMQAAGLEEAARKRLCASGQYIVDSFWKPMVESFPRSEIYEFFEFFRAEHSAIDVEPWDQTTDPLARQVRELIMQGRNAAAYAMLGGEERPLPFGISSKSTRPKLSVVIPVYGTEDFLQECLDSVLGQDFDGLEVVVVNDASRDGSREIIATTAAQDRRVKMLDHPMKSRPDASSKHGNVGCIRGLHQTS